MPELPEVETVARQLAPKLKGRLLERVSVIDSKLSAPRGLRSGARVVDVYRVGKEIAIHFKNPSGKERARGGAEAVVLVHLRMTGRLLWEGERKGGRAGAVRLFRAQAEGVDRAKRIVFYFDRGRLVFSDTRRFGTVKCVREAMLPAGVIDPVSSEFSVASLAALLEGSTQQLKPWLLRQDRLIGIGNIYASEILFAAGISPRRQAGSLSDPEVRRLHRAIRRILFRAIKHCGTTFSDFQQTTGEVGGYQRFLRVYEREGLKCRQCDAAIVRLKQSRSTYYCPGCQPER